MGTPQPAVIETLDESNAAVPTRKKRKTDSLGVNKDNGLLEFLRLLSDNPRALEVKKSNGLRMFVVDTSGNLADFYLTTRITDADALITSTFSTGSGASRGVFVRRMRGGAPAQAGDDLGTVNAQAFDGTNYLTGAQILFQASAVAEGKVSGLVDIRTRKDTTTTSVMKLDAERAVTMNRPRTWFFSADTVTAKATGSTLTANELLGGIITVDTSGGAGNLQLPEATAIEAALPTLAVGGAFQFRVVQHNHASNAVTITTNTGWTLLANMVTFTGVREFLVRRDNVGALQLF